MSNKYTQIKDLNIDDFKQYYYNHSNKDTIKHFNLSQDSFYKLLAANNFPHLRYGKEQQALDNINKDAFISYYENHTLEDTAEYFGITKYIAEYLLQNWGIPKHPISKNLELGNMKKYGVKSYSQTDDFKSKVKNTYNLKSDKEKKERANKISTAFSNMPKEKREERLRKIYSSPNFKPSKPNTEFYRLLIHKGLIEDIDFEREFALGPYIYDFKIDNYLVEINPFATHNSTWGYRNGKPKLPNYHYNKTKYAKINGYECLCIWDWSDKEEIFKLIQNGYKTKQNDKKIHIYNYLTGENRVVSSIPENLDISEVIIYDDGQDISL